MKNAFLALSLLACGLMLSACQTPLVDETGPLAIQSVSVTSKPTVKSETDLVPPLQSQASASLVGGDPQGVPSTVAISIDQVTYKNPLLSLLVGSMNAVTTTVTVSDTDGKTLGTFLHTAVLDAAINGVAGALIASAQDRRDVDATLVKRYAAGIKLRIYGRPGHKPKVAAPVAGAPAEATGAMTASPAARPTPDAPSSAVPVPTS